VTDFGQAVRHHWTLDWSATHLNHGSYGATPKPILAAQDEVCRSACAPPPASSASISAPTARTSPSSTTPPPAPRR
jgi:hypothetical protein